MLIMSWLPAQDSVAAIGYVSFEVYDQNNIFLAIALSLVVLIAWNYLLSTVQQMIVMRRSRVS
jgi:hypothetical protein